MIFHVFDNSETRFLRFVLLIPTFCHESPARQKAAVLVMQQVNINGYKGLKRCEQGQQGIKIRKLATGPGLNKDHPISFPANPGRIATKSHSMFFFTLLYLSHLPTTPSRLRRLTQRHVANDRFLGKSRVSQNGWVWRVRRGGPEVQKEVAKTILKNTI